MPTFQTLGTGGVFGGGAVSLLQQMASLEVRLYRPNGAPWAKGLIRARLNRDCQLYQDAAQNVPLHAISAFEETVLELDESGTGNLLVFQQALLKPLDGTPKTSLPTAQTPQPGTAYNPYYIVTLPDATRIRVVPPVGAGVGQVSGFLDTYVWTPSVYVLF